MAGPLARSAADLRLALEVLGGPDRAARRRVALVAAAGAPRLDPRLPRPLRDRRSVLPGHRRGARASARRRSTRCAPPARRWRRDGPTASIRRRSSRPTSICCSRRWTACQPEEVKAAIRAGDGAEAFASAARASARRSLPRLARRARSRRRRRARTGREFFTTHDAFLSPVSFAPAITPTIHRSRWKRGGSRPPKVIGPTTTCCAGSRSRPSPGARRRPCRSGVTSAGLPVGLQIMGPFLEDATPDPSRRRAGRADRRIPGAPLVSCRPEESTNGQSRGVLQAQAGHHGRRLRPSLGHAPRRPGAPAARHSPLRAEPDARLRLPAPRTGLRRRGRGVVRRRRGAARLGRVARVRRGQG